MHSRQKKCSTASLNCTFFGFLLHYNISCIFPIETKICDDCKNDLSAESAIFEEYHHLRSQIYIFFVEPTEEITRYETFFNEARKVFHPYDSTFMDFMKNFRGLWAKNGEFSRCYEITQMVLINLYHNNPQYDPAIAMEEIWAGRFCIQINKLEEAENHVNKAETIFRISYCAEEDHPIISKVCRETFGAIAMKRSGVNVKMSLKHTSQKQ